MKNVALYKQSSFDAGQSSLLKSERRHGPLCSNVAIRRFLDSLSEFRVRPDTYVLGPYFI